MRAIWFACCVVAQVLQTQFAASGQTSDSLCQSERVSESESGKWRETVSWWWLGGAKLGGACKLVGV